MSALDAIKQAREAEGLGQRVEELGVQLEVLTKRLGELTDEAHEFMDELAEGRERQVLDWNEAQAEAAEVWAHGASEQLESMTQRIEPLAQAMATLSDEARRGIADSQEASRQQAAHWFAAQNAAAESQTAAAKASTQAAAELREAAHAARSAAGQWHGWLWFWVAFAAMAPIAVLLIGFTLWLPLGWTLVPASNGDLYLPVQRMEQAPGTEPATR